MLAQALLVAASGFTTSPLYHSSLRSRAHAPIAMSVVKAEGTPENLESLLSQAEAATGIVCLAVTEPQHQLSNMQIERAGATYASSMLYGGPSCSILQVMCSDAASALALLTDRLQQKAPLELPLVATYSKGALKAVVTPTALEETLLALGARSATSKSNTASRDFGATGGPSATAVDEIDFTVRQQSAVESLRHTPASPAHGLVVPPPCESRPASTACASWIADLPMCVCVCVFRPATLHRLVLSQGGAGNAGRPGFVPKFNDAGRTTRGFFPGSNLEENAGDYITRDDGDGPVDRSRIIGDGKPGGRPNRDDKPPGVA